MSDTAREALERMLTLKQNDWIEACGEIDKLKEKFAEAEKMREFSFKKRVELEEDLEKLESFTGVSITSSGFHGHDLVDELQETKTQLSEALDVIRFYGDENSWITDSYSWRNFKTTISDSDIFLESFKTPTGGKRARDFLKKHGLEKV